VEIYKKFSNGAALPESSRGALHLKHSTLLAKLCSLHPDL
jgi:hypothetical protein